MAIRISQSLLIMTALCAALAASNCKKQSTATKGYIPMTTASRVVPIGDLALIDLDEDGGVSVMLVENGRIVFDLPAGGEIASGSEYITSKDHNYAAIIYGFESSSNPRRVVDVYAIVDGRKGTVTRLGGSWNAADAEWQKLTRSPLTLRMSVRGNGGQPSLPAPTTPPQRFESWSRRDGSSGHNN